MIANAEKKTRHSIAVVQFSTAHLQQSHNAVQYYKQRLTRHGAKVNDE